MENRIKWIWIWVRTVRIAFAAEETSIGASAKSVSRVTFVLAVAMVDILTVAVPWYETVLAVRSWRANRCHVGECVQWRVEYLLDRQCLLVLVLEDHKAVVFVEIACESTSQRRLHCGYGFYWRGELLKKKSTTDVSTWEKQQLTNIEFLVQDQFNLVDAEICVHSERRLISPVCYFKLYKIFQIKVMN